MISPNASPIANVPPYKRIELGAKPKKPEPKWVPVDLGPPVVVSGGWTLQPGYVFPIETTTEIYCG